MNECALVLWPVGEVLQRRWVFASLCIFLYKMRRGLQHTAQVQNTYQCINNTDNNKYQSTLFNMKQTTYT